MTWVSRATPRQPFPTVRFSSAPTGTSTASRRTRFQYLASPSKHRFGRRRPFTALGRGAVNSRKFPRGENDTPGRSWGGQSAFPPAILFGETRGVLQRRDVFVV